MHNYCKKRRKLSVLITSIIIVLIVFISAVIRYDQEKDEFLKFQDGRLQQMFTSTVQVKTAENRSSRYQSNLRSIKNSISNISPVRVDLTGANLSHIFISVKTTSQNHQRRLQLLLNTWIMYAKTQTYIFTDNFDNSLDESFPGHLINTNCSNDHNRRSLICKMGYEFDHFILSGHRWWCHVDDDTYVNVVELVKLLGTYKHTEDWYLGRPSLDHPIEVIDHLHRGQKLAFWFATGGAGFCISRALALKMVPYAGGGRLQRAGDQIRLPDDCTLGYIINSVLHRELTVIDRFHSHLEPLGRISPPDIRSQITFSYNRRKNRINIVNVPGFSEDIDPTRFWSIHCHLYPLSNECLSHPDR